MWSALGSTFVAALMSLFGFAGGVNFSSFTTDLAAIVRGTSSLSVCGLSVAFTTAPPLASAVVSSFARCTATSRICLACCASSFRTCAEIG